MNRYESYENTGLDWVPEIPKHWSVTRSKFIFRNKSIKNCPDEPLLSVTQKDGVVLRSESDLNVWNPTEDVSGYKLIEPSNFVISLRSFEGGLELSTIKGIVSPAYTVLEKTKKINDPYFRWLMKSHQFIIELNKHVTGIRQGKNIGWDDFSNIYLTVPPVEEQKLISRYLDKKTSQIDSLVEMIQKKIELLKEQRTSLINHYVTKGLDPNVEMKDSGVEWIGEIPKHWNVSKVGRHLKLERGRVISNIEIGDNPGPYPVYSSQTKNNGEMGSISTYDFDGEYVSWTTDGANAGTCFHRIGKFNVTNVCGLISSYGLDIDYQFLTFFLNIGTKGYVRQDINPKLMNDMMSEIPLLLVPIHEQKGIVSKIKQTTDRTDKIVELEEKRINLLKIYRQSLISSVVTGKFRVTEDMI